MDLSGKNKKGTAAMELANKKILVPGADGFIGSHLTKKLVAKGYNTKAFVYYKSFNSGGWLDQCDSHAREVSKSLLWT